MREEVGARSGEAGGPRVRPGGVPVRRPGFRGRERSRSGNGRPTRPPQITEARGPAASMLRDALFRRMLVSADVAAIVGAFVLTIALSSRSLQLTWASIAGVPILLLGSKVLGLYDRDETLLRKTTLDEIPKLFQLATLCALAAWLAGGLIVDGELDRHAALFLWLVLAALLMLARTLARAIALRISPAERCLFIGEQALADTIRAKLGGGGGVNAKVVAHLDLDRAGPWSTDGVSSPRLSEIRDLACALDVHRAIVAPRGGGTEMLDLVRTLKAIGVRVSVLPRLLEVVGSAVEFDDLHGMTVMGVRRFRLTRSSRVLKRTFDLVGASLGLLAVSPLFALCAIAVKLDSRGPVFFGELRIGRHGERFRMLKFRTTARHVKARTDDASESREAEEEAAEGRRVTRMGRLLRTSALEQLPQLLNILSGKMSIVGPRPLAPVEDGRVEGWYRRRLELTPGMTGYWQILGPALVPLREMVAIDYLYLANWSLWSDVKILLRTMPLILGRRGL